MSPVAIKLPALEDLLTVYCLSVMTTCPYQVNEVL